LFGWEPRWDAGRGGGGAAARGEIGSARRDQGNAGNEAGAGNVRSLKSGLAKEVDRRRKKKKKKKKTANRGRGESGLVKRGVEADGRTFRGW
jgi:hypothetical protein